MQAEIFSFSNTSQRVKANIPKTWRSSSQKIVFDLEEIHRYRFDNAYNKDNSII